MKVRKKFFTVLMCAITAAVLIMPFGAAAADIGDAYQNTLMNFEKQYKAKPYYYYIYDVDKDGTPELIVDEYNSEAQKKMYFFTFDGKKVVYIGSKSSGHTSLHSVPASNGVLQLVTHMGYESAYVLSIHSNSISEQTIIKNKDCNIYTANGVEGANFSESKDIIEGSEQLKFYRYGDFSPLSALNRSAAVQISLPSFPITLNGVTVQNDLRQYPFIMYNDITYFPMTYGDSRFLGLETLWSAEGGLVIKKADALGDFYGYLGETENSPSDSGEIAGGKIVINGKEIDNASEEYPLLFYRDVTYFPLTWRFAVDEFGWDYSFDAANGLVISCPQ